jgi:cell division protein FtsZ
MGVGEDPELEGAIAITVIATGFNAEQQDEIVNTGAKRIIHTLEEEQKAEHVLTSGPAVIEVPAQVKAEEPIIRHNLFEDDNQEDTPVAVEKIEVPVIEEQIVPEAPTAVQEAPAAVQEEIPFEGYIPTSELIKNIEVDATLLDIHYLAEFEQVDINEIDVKNFVIVEADKKEQTEAFVEVNATKEDAAEIEEQMLMFDLPVNVSEEIQVTSAEVSMPEEQEPELITKKIEDIEVNGAIEIVPVTEITEAGVKRYSLDDYQEVEDALMKAKPTAVAEPTEEELVFETKTIEAPETEVGEDEPVDPLNTPISKLLKDRTEERKRKMKDFNYKFRNSASKIEDIEKQPAYKRMGIELDETDSSDSNISRTSVNTDDDDLDLRSNNSFLHDNVD